MIKDAQIKRDNIMPGVHLSVNYRSGTATLTIGGQVVIFNWNYDAYLIFRDLDNADPIELLATIAQCEKYSPFE